MNKLPNKMALGFTLVELLIAIVVMGGITIATSKILLNMVNHRSKQFAIEDTSSSFRDFINNLTIEVKRGSDIDIADSGNIQIKIVDPDSGTNDKCVAYRFSGTTIEKSEDTGTTTCSGSFAPILLDKLVIGSLEFSPVGTEIDIVNVLVSGNYKDSISMTPFNFSTSIIPRI